MIATYLNIDQSIVFPTTNFVIIITAAHILTETMSIFSLSDVFRCCWPVRKQLFSLDKNDREFEMKDDSNSNERLTSCCYLWKVPKTVKTGRRDDSGILISYGWKTQVFLLRDIVANISRMVMFEQKRTTDWKVIYISITITINNISSNHHHARQIDQFGNASRHHFSFFLVLPFFEVIIVPTASYEHALDWWVVLRHLFLLLLCSLTIPDQTSADFRTSH